MDVALGGGPRDKFLTVDILGMQSRIRQRDTEVHELKGLLRQWDVEVMDLQWQVQEMAAELHEAKSASLARH